MKTSIYNKKIEEIIDQIDKLKNLHDFHDDNNEEEFLNEIESAVISLQETLDIIDRDKAYKEVAESWI